MAKKKAPLRIYSWNVNGIRSVAKKGFLDWLGDSGGHVIGLQETRAREDQLEPELLARPATTRTTSPRSARATAASACSRSGSPTRSRRASASTNSTRRVASRSRATASSSS